MLRSSVVNYRVCPWSNSRTATPTCRQWKWRRNAQAHHRSVCQRALAPESISLSVDGEDVPCTCIKGEPGSANGALLLLSDIFGPDTDDTHAVANKLADAVQSTVYIPDIFKGNPWPLDKKAGTPEFEEWRAALPQQWAIDVILAAGKHAAEAGAVGLGLVGFCYGGGRLVDVLANVPSKQELVQEAMAAAQKEGKSAKEIEDELVVPAYVGGVAFYGTRINTESLKAVRAPLKLLFGESDVLVSKDEVSTFEAIEEELCQKGIFCEVRVFKKQPHGFAHLSGAGDDDARQEALQVAADFLLAIV